MTAAFSPPFEALNCDFKQNLNELIPLKRRMVEAKVLFGLFRVKPRGTLSVGGAEELMFQAVYLFRSLAELEQGSTSLCKTSIFLRKFQLIRVDLQLIKVT